MKRQLLLEVGLVVSMLLLGCEYEEESKDSSGETLDSQETVPIGIIAKGDLEDGTHYEFAMLESGDFQVLVSGDEERVNGLTDRGFIPREVYEDLTGEAAPVEVIDAFDGLPLEAKLGMVERRIRANVALNLAPVDLPEELVGIYYDHVDLFDDHLLNTVGNVKDPLLGIITIPGYYLLDNPSNFKEYVCKHWDYEYCRTNVSWCDDTVQWECSIELKIWPVKGDGWYSFGTLDCALCEWYRTAFRKARRGKLTWDWRMGGLKRRRYVEALGKDFHFTDQCW